MSFIKEYREFILKGNVVDLAIAVVLGAAFGGVVTALTESLLMPIISMVTGKGGVEKLSYEVAGTVFPYGKFLQAVINFLLVAFVLFMVIKGINRLKRKKEAVAPAPPEYTLSEKLLMEIRDGVQKRG
jgi:large conductance mechanosensitive channel